MLNTSVDAERVDDSMHAIQAGVLNLSDLVHTSRVVYFTPLELVTKLQILEQKKLFGYDAGRQLEHLKNVTLSEGCEARQVSEVI